MNDYHIQPTLIDFNNQPVEETSPVYTDLRELGHDFCRSFWGYAKPIRNPKTGQFAIEPRDDHGQTFQLTKWHPTEDDAWAEAGAIGLKTDTTAHMTVEEFCRRSMLAHGPVSWLDEALMEFRLPAVVAVFLLKNRQSGKS